MYKSKKSPFQKRASLIGGLSTAIFILTGVIMLGMFGLFGYAALHPNDVAKAAGQLTKTYLDAAGVDGSLNVTVEKK